MIPSQFQQYQTTLHILSPIHIGTGEELDPFSYVIKEDILHFIDLSKWMDTYPDKEALHRIMDSDNFSFVRLYIQQHIDLTTCTIKTIPIKSQKLLDTYEKAMKEQKSQNQLLINPMTRNDINKIAFIPGSSIKGAMRTAIANAFVDKARVSSNDAFGRNNYNRKIFGPPNKDPMKNVKVSDISLNETSTYIFEAQEMSNNPDKSLTPKGFLEATISEITSDHMAHYPLKVMISPFELYHTQVDVHFIIDTLNQFYIPKFFHDEDEFYRHSMPKIGQIAFLKIKDRVHNMSPNEALIRVGHFSHIECMTLDHVRKPRTKRGKDGKPLPWGTTRTLANGLFPFGWAIIEFEGVQHTPRVKDYITTASPKNDNQSYKKSTHKHTHKKKYKGPQKDSHSKPATIEDLMNKFNQR